MLANFYQEILKENFKNELEFQQGLGKIRLPVSRVREMTFQAELSGVNIDIRKYNI